MTTKSQKPTQTLTTAQQLGSLVKSARDIMRKDKGLSGELDRLPMLVWILFLKFLDDSEKLFEQEAKLAGKRYHPTVEPPYRWRDWATGKDSLTGDALIAFINQEEAMRPDGTKGQGLFAYLRSLEGGDSRGKTRKDVIANVFRGTVNRMISGYLLRDLVDKVGGIHFDSTEEMQTLGLLYESMLREMRDAAGDSGEFYTPRSVVQFMVRVTDPKIGETQRVDIVLTNPPFGGEEETAVKANFPADMQTSETALLFLQYIMRMLRRSRGVTQGGRAAVVVPNGTLFGDGVCARIKQELLTEFDLHTIVRLPGSVFAPYTSIQTNILFFTQGSPTKQVWFYEIAPPAGRKNYTKTQPIRFSEFEPCIAWWKKRKTTPQAWKVSAKELLANGCNLDQRNPNAKEDPLCMSPENLIGSILANEAKLVELIKEVKNIVAQLAVMNWTAIPIGSIVQAAQRQEKPVAGKQYRQVGVRLWGSGAYERETIDGSQTKYKVFNRTEVGDIIVNKIWARNGSVSVIDESTAGCYCSGEFPLYTPDFNRLDPRWFYWITKTKWFWDSCNDESFGTSGKNRIRPEKFLAIEIPLPPLSEQERIVKILATLTTIDAAKALHQEVTQQLDALTQSTLDKAFKGEL